MSYLLQGNLARIVLQGIQGLDTKLFQLKPKGPSQKIQDYMHMGEFESLVNRTKSLQQITHVNPIGLMSFTEINQATILQCLLSGGSVENALQVAGVKKKHFDLWISLADKQIEPFHSYIIECDKAQGLMDLELIQKMRMGGWKGAIELYKMRHPELQASVYGGSGPAINNVQVNIMNKRPEEKKAVFDAFKSLADPSQVIDVEP